MEGKKRTESRIPVSSPSPLRRTGSLRLGTCPPIKEHQSNKKEIQSKLSRRHSLQSLNTASSYTHERDDDADSVASFSSSASVCSNMSQCDHAHFARNGTTYSGRCKRYVVHCSPHSTETDDYLTPTQRTNRTIRRLRSLLKDAQADLLEKDKEILRLTKEVVELRLMKVDSTTSSNDSGTVDQAQGESVTDAPSLSHQNTSSPRPRFCSTPPLAPSLSDSGHFEELHTSKETSSTIQSHINNQIKTIESLQRQHEDEIRELKEMHNDKVDSLLQRITDVSDRYYALRPLYEDAKEKISELEKINGELRTNICHSHNNKIAELETENTELLQEKMAVTDQLNDLKSKFEVLEVEKFNCDELFLENNELKKKQNELMGIINTKTGVEQQTCEHNDQCSYKKENSELKKQIEAHIEQVKHLEEQLHNQQLHNKAMDMVPEEIIENTVTTEETIFKSEMKEYPIELIENGGITQNPIVSDLLQKLEVKQEELDNVKAMYRRLLASRKDQPKHDPEMTLQFLKSAFYYFLTDRENAPGHLSAIESILGFTDTEKLNIDKAFLWR